MNMLGFSFNVVTMGALVIAIGMMVDSSIVVLESCFRLKDETRRSPKNRNSTAMESTMPSINVLATEERDEMMTSLAL